MWFAIFFPYCGYVINFSKPNTLYTCLFKIITMPGKLTVDIISFIFVFFFPFTFFFLKFNITILKLFNMWLSKTNLDTEYIVELLSIKHLAFFILYCSFPFFASVTNPPKKTFLINALILCFLLIKLKIIPHLVALGSPHGSLLSKFRTTENELPALSAKGYFFLSCGQ